MPLSRVSPTGVQVLTAGDNEEMCYCLKAWQALPRSVQFGATPSTVEALQATAVVDRLRRAVGALSMSVSDRIQVPPALPPPLQPHMLLLYLIELSALCTGETVIQVVAPSAHHTRVPPRTRHCRCGLPPVLPGRGL